MTMIWSCVNEVVMSFSSTARMFYFFFYIYFLFFVHLIYSCFSAHAASWLVLCLLLEWQSCGGGWRRRGGFGWRNTETGPDSKGSDWWLDPGIFKRAQRSLSGWWVQPPEEEEGEKRRGVPACTPQRFMVVVCRDVHSYMKTQLTIWGNSFYETSGFGNALSRCK